MGAVQKLATVVIVGLVGLATLLVIMLADEPNRIDVKADEHDELAIERGISLYITYCLQCHGPAGEGVAFEEAGRVGAALGGQSEATWINQSEDPVQRAEREEFIRFRITNGQPPAGPQQGLLMPAFGQELNEEQINNLVYMIQNVSWNRVYNAAIEAAGGYPTAPPVEGAEAAEGEAAAAEGGVVTVEAVDPAAWTQSELTVAPGDTIEVVNSGATEHDFVVEELGIDSGRLAAGETAEVVIAEDVPPGEYEFICSVPGHAQLGMVGTLIVEG